jgi:hypothetical protein
MIRLINFTAHKRLLPVKIGIGANLSGPLTRDKIDVYMELLRSSLIRQLRQITIKNRRLNLSILSMKLMLKEAEISC